MTNITASPPGGITKYTPPTEASAGKPQKDTTPSANGSSLKETDFLHLLTTQLQHQDPLNPEKDTDFAAQMAQYSSLAEMRKLNDTIGKQSMYAKVSSAASLIGKSVTTSDVDGNGKPTTGTVSAINVAPDGTVLLRVGDTSVPIEHVSAVAQLIPHAPSLTASLPSSQTANGPASPTSGLASSAVMQPVSQPVAAASVQSSLQAAVQRAASQAIAAAAQSAGQPASGPVSPASTAATAAIGH
ncbi:MAG: flagellar hook capping FlgD N-terminal domain-containing protein [Capsulimonadaceae bacterium]|nr:flagellar hook capping FlgD N-terminal domain-containing protein [Capsulimonadaceae bacterium]